MNNGNQTAMNLNAKIKLEEFEHSMISRKNFGKVQFILILSKFSLMLQTLILFFCLLLKF